jgi:hypothetical protein
VAAFCFLAGSALSTGVLAQSPVPLGGELFIAGRQPSILPSQLARVGANFGERSRSSAQASHALCAVHKSGTWA